MSLRAPAVSLLIGWLCASGAVLDVAQVFAWTRMFAGYARRESILAAARDTLDPAKPCGICLAVGKAREATGRQVPAQAPAAADRIVLVFESPATFIAESAKRTWPAVPSARALVRDRDVPVPPPRSRCA